MAEFTAEEEERSRALNPASLSRLLSRFQSSGGVEIFDRGGAGRDGGAREAGRGTTAIEAVVGTDEGGGERVSRA